MEKHRYDLEGLCGITFVSFLPSFSSQNVVTESSSFFAAENASKSDSLRIYRVAVTVLSRIFFFYCGTNGKYSTSRRIYCNVRQKSFTSL